MIEKYDVEEVFTVRRELGLHARPAGLFAATAGKFRSEIWVARQGSSEWMSASSVLSLLSMAATRGTVLVIRALGEDAKEAVAALGAIIEQEFEATLPRR